MTNLGITGMLFVQLVVQLSYNNWKWPLVVLREFNVNFIDFVKKGIIWSLEYKKGIML